MRVQYECPHIGAVKARLAPTVRLHYRRRRPHAPTHGIAPAGKTGVQLPKRGAVRHHLAAKFFLDNQRNIGRGRLYGRGFSDPTDLPSPNQSQIDRPSPFLAKSACGHRIFFHVFVRPVEKAATGPLPRPAANARGASFLPSDVLGPNAPDPVLGRARCR